MPLSPPDAIDNLHTVRDWLRYGATAFSRAQLVFGHGTSCAMDEAAFLILMALDLPIDQLDPWLDARLTVAERVSLAALIHRRIETRKPASYLVNAAFIQGHRFYVDERVIVPRSYIGELLAGGLAGVVTQPDAVHSVLDLCTGSGCLAILAALAFPSARIDALDISPDACAVAARNIADYGMGDRITLIQSNLFDGLPAGQRYDLILANPPYVADAEVAAFSPEYRAEPLLAHAGGTDGLDLVHTIIAGADAHLNPGGMLVVEIGTGQARLEAAYPGLPFLWLDTGHSEGEVFALPAATAPPTARPAATAPPPPKVKRRR